MLVRLWRFVLIQENRQLLGFIGGTIAAIVAAVWAVFTYFHPANTVVTTGNTAAPTAPLASAPNISNSEPAGSQTNGTTAASNSPSQSKFQDSAADHHEPAPPAPRSKKAPFDLCFSGKKQPSSARGIKSQYDDLRRGAYTYQLTWYSGSTVVSYPVTSVFLGPDFLSIFYSGGVLQLAAYVGATDAGDGGYDRLAGAWIQENNVACVDLDSNYPEYVGIWSPIDQKHTAQPFLIKAKYRN